MAKPISVNDGHVYDPANPHTHLTLIGDPANSTGPRCMAGTLRPTHQGHTNSAAAFARTKLTPATQASATDWTITAHRAEVLLPSPADDRLGCPRTLFEMVDAEHFSTGKALLSYITFTWRPKRLHQQWELGRRLARELCAEHNVGILAVHHVPSKVGSTSDPHLHLVIVPRRIEAWGGFGSYVTALIGDRVWTTMKARFGAALAESGEAAS